MAVYKDRNSRDLERLAGRRGDREQRAILWSEFPELAKKIFNTLSKSEIASLLNRSDPSSRGFGQSRINPADLDPNLNDRITAAFERHDEALANIESGPIFELLNESRLRDAVLAVQDVTGQALTVVQEEKTDLTNATITQDYYTKADIGSATAGVLLTFRSELEDPNGISLGATLIQDYRTEVDTDQAITSAIDTLKSDLTDPDGNSLGAEIKDIQNVKVDAAGAIGAVNTEISATFNDLQALASTTATAFATADKIEAGYILRLNGSNIFEAISVQDGVDGAQASTFRLNTDLVQIKNTAQIDDAVITTANIGFAEVDTLNIAGNAATVAAFNKLQSDVQGVGNPPLGVISTGVSIPPQSNIDVFIVVNFAQGYNFGPRDWSFSISGGIGTSRSLITDRLDMTFGNDYPVVAYLESFFYAGSSHAVYNVDVAWAGEDGDIILLADQTVVSVIARWR